MLLGVRDSPHECDEGRVSGDASDEVRAPSRIRDDDWKETDVKVSECEMGSI